MYCCEATAVNHQPGKSIAYAIPCKRWSCEECAQENSRRLKRQALSGRPDLFATLTVNPSVGENATERAGLMRDAFRLIRRRAIAEATRDPKKRPRKKALKRDWPADHPEDGPWPRQVRLYNGKLPFQAVVEATENGEPHLHLLTRAAWVSKNWLSAQLQELTGAFIVDVKRIRNRRRAAAYVSKYVGKGPAKFDGLKRHWRSRDYLPEIEAPETASEAEKLVWWRVNSPLGIVVADAAKEGWRVNWRGNSVELYPP